MPSVRNQRETSPIEGDYRAMLESVLPSRSDKRARSPDDLENPDDDLDRFTDRDSHMDMDRDDAADASQIVSSEAIECSEQDIEAIKNPNLRSFIRNFGLARHLLGPLESSIRSFEFAVPSEELQLYEDFDTVDGATDIYHAHPHQVMMLALPMLAMQKAQEALTLTERFASSIQEQLDKLAVTMAEIKAAQVLKVKDPASEDGLYGTGEQLGPTLLRGVVCAFFYSGQAPGYACGSKEKPGASKILENKAMEYFQQRPDELGLDGEALMSKPAGRKVVRVLIKNKLDSLSNVTKDRLAQSIGLFGGQPWNLLDLAKQLYSSAGLAITPLRLYRLSFLRTAAASKQIYLKAEKKNSRGKVTTKWVANPDFWAEVDKELKPLMRDLSSADENTQKAATQALKQMYRNDQAKYGKFTFDMSAPKERKEQELDQHLAQASKEPAQRQSGKGKTKVVEADESDLEIKDEEPSSPPHAPREPATSSTRPSARPFSTSRQAGPRTSLPANAGVSMSGAGSGSRSRTASPDLHVSAAGIVMPGRESIETAARVARNNGITPGPGSAASSSGAASSSQLPKLRSSRNGARKT
ncbi:hypothetical protein V8E36_002151 [Tilletia maclaganii]